MDEIIKLEILLNLIDKKAIETLIAGGSIAIDTEENITYHDDDCDDEENKEVFK